jgi:hypothetical protein
LKGQKKVFAMFEICPINVEPKYSKVLTIDRLLEKLGNDHGALNYLPNQP